MEGRSNKLMTFDLKDLVGEDGLWQKLSPKNKKREDRIYLSARGGMNSFLAINKNGHPAKNLLIIKDNGEMYDGGIYVSFYYEINKERDLNYYLCDLFDENGEFIETKNYAQFYDFALVNGIRKFVEKSENKVVAISKNAKDKPITSKDESDNEVDAMYDEEDELGIWNGEKEKRDKLLNEPDSLEKSGDKGERIEDLFLYWKDKLQLAKLILKYLEFNKPSENLFEEMVNYFKNDIPRKYFCVERIKDDSPYEHPDNMVRLNFFLESTVEILMEDESRLNKRKNNSLKIKLMGKPANSNFKNGK